MFDEIKKYKNKEHFFFEKGQNLMELTKDIPDLPGVYYILRLAHGKIDIIYIGKSDTVQINKKGKDKGLKSHLNSNYSLNITRQEYFDINCIKENIDALDIYWFVTYDDKTKDSPAFVENLILLRYLETYHKLPNWNKKF